MVVLNFSTYEGGQNESGTSIYNKIFINTFASHSRDYTILFATDPETLLLWGHFTL